MADYFTSDHFKLLNKWKGTIYDPSNPEQQAVYEELSQAFDVTKRWAEAVQKRFFPTGWSKTVRKPTDQWQRKFIRYNWGRIYPSSESPLELAYTVGIDATVGFVVKIDVVDTQTEDPALRTKYEAIRGAWATSPIVATLSVVEGLAKSFPDLVDWAVMAIRGFTVRYDDLLPQLNLGKLLSDEDLLRHFDGKPAFKTFRASWSPQDKTMFCRLARAVHAAGLDWWHMNKDIQVRFGRKHPGSARATGLLGVIRGTRVRKISWVQDLGPMTRVSREPLTDDLVAKVEAALDAERGTLNGWWGLDTGRPGLWPDQLRDDLDDSDEETEDEEPLMGAMTRSAFNRIYYGPPGTGKTYAVSQLLQRDYQQATASVSAEEWRQQLIVEQIASLTWWEAAAAALYDLGGRAKVAQIHAHPFIQAVSVAKGRHKNVPQTLWGTLQHHTIEDSTSVNIKLRLAPAVFDKTTDSIWHFAGDWEEICADLVDVVRLYRDGVPAADTIQRYSFVTFHQSYGYEEFVEGLRPVLAGDAEGGEIQYEIRSGAFKDLCRRASAAPEQRFAMVIDEINRGNISKILGELITLIEPDKREGATNAISVSLPYSGESFSVPSNVDIIGTMNTADRSLALLDTALRRRFEFVPVLPDVRDEAGAPLYGLSVILGEQVIDIPRMLSVINQRVEALYDRDHCIGHAYFTSLAQIPDGDERLVALSLIFNHRIVPLLEEYFFEDWQKIRLVLADNQKPKSACFVIESRDQEEDLVRLFGSDHGLDSYATKQRYAVQDAAFTNPDAYIGIYQTLPV